MKSSTRLLGTAALAVSMSIGVGAPAAFAHGDHHGHGEGHHGYAAHSDRYGDHDWGRSDHHRSGWSDWSEDDHEGWDHGARADDDWDRDGWKRDDDSDHEWSRDGKWDRDRHTWKRDDKWDRDRYEWKRDDKYDPDRYQWKRDDDDANREARADRAPAARSIAAQNRARAHAKHRAAVARHADFAQRQEALVGTLQKTAAFLDTLHSRIAASDMDPTVQNAVLGAIEAYQTRIADLTAQAQAATTLDDLQAVVDQLKRLFPTAMAPMTSGARYAAMAR